jgi:hypothetical protein
MISMRHSNNRTRRSQRRFAALLMGLWLIALLAVPLAVAQDATATPEPALTEAAGETGDEAESEAEAAEDEAESAPETETAEADGEAESEAEATAPLPGVTLLIFGIGVSIVIGTGSAMLFREAAERRAGRTPSL